MPAVMDTRGPRSIQVTESVGCQEARPVKRCSLLLPNGLTGFAAQTSPAASCFSETGYDYWGGDIKNYASVSSSQACCNLCSADSSCK